MSKGVGVRVPLSLPEIKIWNSLSTFSKIKGQAQLELPINYEKASPELRRQAREQYIVEQQYRCYFCKEKLDEVPNSEVRSKPLNLNLFPSGFLRHPIHLHHCHRTGMTIGAVHAECNGYLWQYLGE